MILSILIPSIPKRNKRLKSLKRILDKQIKGELLAKVEIIIDDSPSVLDGGMSIGKKREKLVMQAQGEYCCFLDDDDEISPNYISVLLSLCEQGQHICTFRSFAKLEGYWCLIDMNLENKENEQAFPGIVKRTPWHICPVRTEFAKNYLFQDSNYGEDWEWFSKVLVHCETQANSPAIIHQYNHTKKSEADRAAQV